MMQSDEESSCDVTCSESEESVVAHGNDNDTTNETSNEIEQVTLTSPLEGSPLRDYYSTLLKTTDEDQSEEEGVEGKRRGKKEKEARKTKRDSKEMKTLTLKAAKRKRRLSLKKKKEKVKTPRGTPRPEDDEIGDKHNKGRKSRSVTPRRIEEDKVGTTNSNDKQEKEKEKDKEKTTDKGTKEKEDKVKEEKDVRDKQERSAKRKEKHKEEKEKKEKDKGEKENKQEKIADKAEELEVQEKEEVDWDIENKIQTNEEEDEEQTNEKEEEKGPTRVERKGSVEDEEDVWGIRQQIRELNESINITTKRAEEERIRRMSECKEVVDRVPKSKTLASKVKGMSQLKRKKSLTSQTFKALTSSTNNSPITTSSSTTPTMTTTTITISTFPAAPAPPPPSIGSPFSPFESATPVTSPTGGMAADYSEDQPKKSRPKLDKAGRTMRRKFSTLRKKTKRGESLMRRTPTDEALMILEREDVISPSLPRAVDPLRLRSGSGPAPYKIQINPKRLSAEWTSNNNADILERIRSETLPIQSPTSTYTPPKLRREAIGNPVSMYGPAGMDAPEFSDEEDNPEANAQVIRDRWAEISSLDVQTYQTHNPECREFVAIYEFVPEGNVELGFRVGDRLLIFSEHDEDGWYQAQHCATGEVGYIPANYVRSVRDMQASAEGYYNHAAYTSVEYDPTFEWKITASQSTEEEEEDEEWSESDEEPKNYEISQRKPSISDALAEPPAATDTQEEPSFVDNSSSGDVHQQPVQPDMATSEGNTLEFENLEPETTAPTETTVVTSPNEAVGIEMSQESTDVQQQQEVEIQHADPLSKEELLAHREAELEARERAFLEERRRFLGQLKKEKKRKHSFSLIGLISKEEDKPVFFDKVPKEWVPYLEAINKVLKQLKRDGEEGSDMEPQGLTEKEVEKIILGDLLDTGLTRAHSFPETAEEIACYKNYVTESLAAGKKKEVVELRGSNEVSAISAMEGELLSRMTMLAESQKEEPVVLKEPVKEESIKEQHEQRNEESAEAIAVTTEDPSQALDEKVKLLEAKLKKTKKNLAGLKKAKLKDQKNLQEKMMEMRVKLNLMMREADEEEEEEADKQTANIKKLCEEDIKALASTSSAKKVFEYKDKVKKLKETLSTLKEQNEKRELELQKRIKELEQKLQKPPTPTESPQRGASTISTLTRRTTSMRRRENLESAAHALGNDVNFVFLVSMAIYKQRKRNAHEGAKLWQN